MKWKSPDQKKSSFVKDFLKKDTSKDTQKDAVDPSPKEKNHAQWNVKKGRSSKFIADFFKHQNEESNDDTKISLRVLGI